MALCGPWGVFYKIPKTGSSWVGNCLKNNMGYGHESGQPHGWIHPFESGHPAQPFIKKGPFFTFVRHPATWLRSFWAHAGAAKWIGRDKGDGHWGNLVWITRPYASNDFEEFAIGVTENIPGLVGWFMGTYCQPHVMVGCMEDYPHSLKAVVPGLMCTLPPKNKAKTALPKINDDLMTKIERSEAWLMKKFYRSRGHKPIDREVNYNFDVTE